MDILFLSPADWNGPRGRFQHIAERLARHNRVLYVDGLGVRAPRLRDWKRIVSRATRLVADAAHPPRIHDVLFHMRPVSIPCQGRGPAGALNRFLLRRHIDHRLRRMRFVDPLVWISYPHPALVDVLDDVAPRLVIYDIVDDWTAFDGSYRTMASCENRLIERSNLVLATSERLRDRASRLNANTFLVPNGVDLELFGGASAATPPDDVRPLPRPRIGFVGNIASWIDLDLVVEVARRRPDWSVVLVGPWKRLQPPLPRNVHSLGYRRHDRVPDYVASFDVCLIPFLRNTLTESVDPVKVYEYLAAGKPVVATPLPALRRFEKLLYFASSAEEIVAMIEHALAEPADRARERRDAMQAHSWRERMTRIHGLSREVLGVSLAPAPGNDPEDQGPIDVMIVYPWTSFWAMGEGCGAESFYRCAHGYVEHGHRVRVLMPVIGSQPAPAAVDGMEIERVPFDFDPMRDPGGGAGGFAARMTRYVRFQRTMGRAAIGAARRRRPDVVVALGAYAAPVARRAAEAAGVPNVTRLFGQSLARHLDNDGHVRDRLRFRANVSELRAFRTRCDALIVHDDGSRGDLVARRLGVADEHFHYWRDGVSPVVASDRARARATLGVPGDAVVAAYVGRLSVEKSLFAILRSFEDADGACAGLHLVFVGDGPLRGGLEAAARRSPRAGYIHFPGAFRHEHMGDVFPGIDIVISVSDRTNMTNATIEAMAAGIAVIALDAGDTSAIVHDGDTGILITREDDLAPALVRLSHDADLRHGLGSRARAFIADRFETVETRVAREVELVAGIARRARSVRGGTVAADEVEAD